MKKTFKPSTKYKIKDPDEMAKFVHMKRKGGHVQTSKKAYKRKQKHQKNDYND